MELAVRRHSLAPVEVTVLIAIDVLYADPSYELRTIGCLSTSDNGNGRLITGMKFDYGDNGMVRLTNESKDHSSRSGG